MPSIQTLIRGKDRKQKSLLKAREMAKLDFVGEYENEKYGIRNKILRMDAIPGGVSFLVQTWKNGKQLGFGADGSVDIERFRFFNAPFLVDDPNGNILREVRTEEGQIMERVLREDPIAALLESLAHSSNFAGIEQASIKKGKVGNTTSTIFASYDAYFLPAGAADFAASRALTTAAVDSTTANLLGVGVRNDGVNAVRIARSGMTFATNVIGSDVISSGVVSLMPVFHTDDDNDAQAYITLDKFTPASSSSYVGGDWDNFAGDKQTSDKDISAVVDETYSDFTYIDFNDVNTGGDTCLMAREGHDYENIAAVLSAGQYSRVHFYQADETGTSKDPKAVFIHAAALSKEMAINRTPIRGVGRGIMRP